jgi:hypothetical protein
MAEYIVRAGGQGEGGTLPSLGAAVAVARAGDTVIVYGGVYKERFVPPQGTTWRAAPGETPVIDGRWNGQNAPTGEGRRPQVLISKRDVTMTGFTVRNVPGAGVAVTGGGDNFTMTDCLIHDCFDSATAVNGLGHDVENVTFRNVHVRRVSRSWVVEESPKGVAGCFLFRYARNALVEDCSVSESYGEGMAAGIQSVGVTFRRVTIHTTMHLAVYASNRAQNVLLEDCVFYQTGDPEYRQGDGDVGAGIVIGDETRPDDKDDDWRHAENVTIRRCLVVNAGTLFNIRNNLKAGKGNGQYDGYETRIQNLRVENCTFVSGPLTRTGIAIQENQIGHAIRGVVTGCVFVLDRLADAGAPFRSNAPGLRFEGNAFTVMPPGLASGNEATTAAALVDPFAPLAAGFSLDNYRPVAGSAVALAGLGALAAQGEPPPPPPPPPPDDDEWVSVPVAEWQRIQELTAAARASLAELAELIEEPAA